MVKGADHKSNINALKRIEGQVRGVQRMIEEEKYCVDILTQLSAVRSALARVEDAILEKHFKECVTKAVRGTSRTERQKKLDEVLMILKRSRKRCELCK